MFTYTSHLQIQILLKENNQKSWVYLLLELHRANVFKVNFHLEKDDQHYPVKDFPKIVSKFLNQDVFKNKESIESLMENVLLIENVDSEFPHNNKLVVNML